MKTEKFMTTSEFAKRIGIHPQTVRRWDREGKLPAHHRTPGGRRYYAEEQAEAFLNHEGTEKK